MGLQLLLSSCPLAAADSAFRGCQASAASTLQHFRRLKCPNQATLQYPCYSQDFHRWFCPARLYQHVTSSPLLVSGLCSLPVPTSSMSIKAKPPPHLCLLGWVLPPLLTGAVPVTSKGALACARRKRAGLLHVHLFRCSGSL